MSSEPKIIIAIDGYSSSGKSTMARRLASEIGYRYIDSGAMYRAVTLWAMRHDMVAQGVDPDVDAIVAALPEGIVMDGRDIGTVVFPDAEMKVFCDASAERRAERRYKELVEKGAGVTFEEVLDNVRTRDHIDETRAEGPLRCADDAVRLDNSSMTIDEQNSWLLDLYRSRISSLG